MSQQSDDVTIALLEHERASPNIRLSWAFPAPGELNANVLGARAQLTADVPLPSSQPTFAWSRWRGLWWYTFSRGRKPSGEPDCVHAVVDAFAVAIGSPLFDPERHHALLKVLLKAFEAEGGSPLALLQRVLSVSTKGTASAGADVPSFAASNFDAAAAKLACPLGSTIAKLGAEHTATLWAAMLLRGRVAVYEANGDVSELLSLVRALPLLAWHRRWEASLRGLCCLSEKAEVAELEAAGSLAAGFVDAAILERPELYDVLLTRGGKGGGLEGLSLKLNGEGGASLKPPPAVAKAVAKALSSCGAGAGERELVDALAAKTAEFLEKAADVASQPQSDESDAELPEGVAAWLRKLHAAEEMGVGASA